MNSDLKVEKLVVKDVIKETINLFFTPLTTGIILITYLKLDRE